MRLRYTNPVFRGYFADPYVWRSSGRYLAIGTGAAEASELAPSLRSIFPLLSSTDLVDWEPIGYALPRPDVAADTFWAPEVVHAEGRWYLYYSAGQSDKNHRLWVAVADAAEGPYANSVPLTDVAEVPFAIDAHPFRDDDGRWYLFHARDFLDSDRYRAGTAIVVHELETMTRLAGKGSTVLRPRFDWQRFAADRPMYGRTFDWHTLEGPFVVREQERYYCLYSGGCWENESYGVDYAVGEHVLGPYDDRGAEAGPRVLKTIPGRVLGPGHCSAVVGPDDATRVLVYHAWDERLSARTMRIDELLVTTEGLRSNGPSWTERELRLATDGRREPEP